MLSDKRAAALVAAIVIGLAPELLVARANLFPHGTFALAHGIVARDFGDFWSAAHLARAGLVRIIFHPALFQHWLEQRFTFVHGARLWSYPPSMLLLVLPVGWFGPVTGFLLWSVAGLVALSGAVSLLVPRRSLLAVLLLIAVVPAVWDNILVGQNAAFTGALMIAGFSLLDRRPGWAGVAFGLLTLKPQLGLLVPMAMVANRQWRAVAIAAMVALGMAAISALAFRGSWMWFFAHVEPAMQHRLLRFYQPTASQAYMSSAFIAARALKSSVAVAWAVQALVSALAGYAMIRLWARDRDHDASRRLRIAASLALCLAATPFSLDYDGVGASVMLAVLLVTQGQSLRRDWFELALVALAMDGWALVLALALPIPVFPWLIWLILGCWIAFAPEKSDPVLQRALAINTGRAR